MTLLRHAMYDKSLMGIRVCREALAINHLLFIDDSLIFCKATTETSNHLFEILKTYIQASGQCINTEKTTMVFNRNVKEVTRAEISSMWGCRDTKQYDKYLGLPLFIGRSKKRVFFKIKTKV